MDGEQVRAASRELESSLRVFFSFDSQPVVKSKTEKKKQDDNNSCVFIKVFRKIKAVFRKFAGVSI